MTHIETAIIRAKGLPSTTQRVGNFEVRKTAHLYEFFYIHNNQIMRYGQFDKDKKKYNRIAVRITQLINWESINSKTQQGLRKSFHI